MLQQPQCTDKQTQTALITGATGGLGRELCKEFARRGYNLVVTARNPERLRALAEELRRTFHCRVTALVADLNQPDAAQLLYEKTHAAGLVVDVLVNNAGFGLGGNFVHNRPRLQGAMIHVNITAPTRLCRLFLPGMLERGYGGILNIVSTGSLVPGPYNSVYCASKAYLLHLSEALAEELRCTPVVVTAVCPGAMRTDFAHRAGLEATPLFRCGLVPPDRVARYAVRAFLQGRAFALPGPIAGATALAVRLAPRGLAARVSGALQQQHTVPKRPQPHRHTAAQ